MYRLSTHRHQLGSSRALTENLYCVLPPGLSPGSCLSSKRPVGGGGEAWARGLSSRWTARTSTSNKSSQPPSNLSRRLLLVTVTLPLTHSIHIPVLSSRDLADQVHDADQPELLLPRLRWLRWCRVPPCPTGPSDAADQHDRRVSLELGELRQLQLSGLRHDAQTTEAARWEKFTFQISLIFKNFLNEWMSACFYVLNTSFNILKSNVNLQYCNRLPYEANRPNIAWKSFI